MRELPDRTPRGQGAPDPIDIAVGARLRLRRKQLGLSQSELGQYLGLTFQQIQKYERGANRISASMLVRAANRLECPVAHLVGETGDELTPDLPVDSLKTPGALELLDAYAAAPEKARRRIIKLVQSLSPGDDGGD